VPYGFDFSKPVGRFEEALQVIRMLWESDGPVDFEGQFFKLQHARMDTDLYNGRCPPIWIGASGPRMLEITGRYADGWWPAGSWTPEDYAAKLKVIRDAAERAGRDPMAIVPAFIQTCLIGDDDELADILKAPLVKAILLQISAAELRKFGHAHPMGESWRGFQDIDPHVLTRERILDFVDKVDPRSILDLLPHGTPKQVAKIVKSYCDAGLRVPKILDYGGMAGLKYGALSPQKVREAEDELLKLTAGI
jgi:phthiodiolone/phenolphthiodiolone dimycocerosates ketoreductase